MPKVMTTEELKRRKKLQAGISVTTSTLGLAALGMKGGSVAAGRVARSAKAANKAMAGGPAKFSPMANRARKYKKVSNTLNRSALNTGIVSSGIGGVGGYNFASYTRAESKRKQPVAKAADWQNISEHERRARDSRRTRERGKSAAGLGVGIATGAPVARELFHPESAPIGHQVRNVARNVRAGTRIGRTIANNPYGAAALGGIGLAGAGVATMAGARANERRHDVAIAHQRKKRATQSVVKNYGGTMDFGLSGVHQGRNVLLPVPKPQEVAKAYDPERNRQKRLGHYATAASTGAGAAGFGAGYYGAKAVGRPASKVERTVKGATKVVTKPGTGMFAGGKGKVPVRSLKHAGIAAGLGATAAGLAIGSERIRSYKHGKGKSYTPLAQIRMS